jgi:vanillate O-demethylase monooxygenase subunit
MTTLIRNAWYVAVWGREADQTLRRFTILGDQILLYRKADGHVVALDDRCPHRLLPLSKGTRTKAMRRSSSRTTSRSPRISSIRHI